MGGGEGWHLSSGREVTVSTARDYFSTSSSISVIIAPGIADVSLRGSLGGG